MPGASEPVKISASRSAAMFCEPSGKPSRPRASATPGRLRVEGLSSAKRWKQACAQRPSSRPFVRRITSRTAWWVIIAWSDCTSSRRSPWQRRGSRLSPGNEGMRLSAAGASPFEPEAPVEQRRAQRERDGEPPVVAIVEAELARVRRGQRRVRDRVEAVGPALGELADALGEVAEEALQVVGHHVVRGHHPVGRALGHDPGLARARPGSSSEAAASSSSSSREAPKAPAATAAPPAAPWTKRLRETPLTPVSRFDAERPLHAGQRLGQRLDGLLHLSLLGRRRARRRAGSCLPRGARPPRRRRPGTRRRSRPRARGPWPRTSGARASKNSRAPSRLATNVGRSSFE